MRDGNRSNPRRERSARFDPDRPLHRAMPAVLSLFAVYSAIAFLVSRSGGGEGRLGNALLSLSGGLLGGGAACIPPLLAWLALVWRGDLRAGRLGQRAGYFSAFVLLVSAILSRTEAAGGLDAFRQGLSLSGGGLFGWALGALLGFFGGAPAFVLAALILLAFYLFAFLGFSPAVLLPAVRRISRRRAGGISPPDGDGDGRKGKKHGMKNESRKAMIVDDGGYYPTRFGEEDFSQIRAKLEREESVNADGIGGARAVYPDAAPARSPYDVPVTEEPVSLPLEREQIGGEKENAIPDGNVISAAEAFGAGVPSFLREPEDIPLSPVRSPRLNASDYARAAGDAPFAHPAVPKQTVAAPTYSAPTYSTPVAPTAGTPAYSAPVAPTTGTPIYSAPVPPSAVQTGKDAAEDMTAEELISELDSETPEEEIPSAEIAAARSRAEEEEREEEAEDAPSAGTVFGAQERFPLDMPASQIRISDASAIPLETGPAGTVKPAPVQSEIPYIFPPLSLLKPAENTGGSTDEEIHRNADSLLETLASFNVSASIRHVSRGPRITRYELIPKRGIRIRNITNLQDDISMNLATAGIRIEAPIPGLAAVGVEVPNRKPTTVSLRNLLDHESFRTAGSKTTVCVGADVTGEPVYGDIAKMPHALIAGATGMGKSVCINAILISLLYKARPDEVKLILVDPKKVELNVYNGIPHLLVPVVVEPQKAAGALVWAVGEMERRFNMIEAAGVRDIKGFNRFRREHPEDGQPLPQIVIVIDELNDLMMSARDAVEDSICRIAQKARAAGIHLLIGTQRPSVDVITGVIKANIPSRIAFHVSSMVDSRTILDIGGAEKLLNNGDMLFFPVGVPKPVRVQGAFVSDEEVEAVTSFLKRGVSGETLYDSEVMANIDREAEKCAPKDKRAERSEDDEGGYGRRDEDPFSDPQFLAAVEIAVGLGQISTCKIQTKLRIGFQKATNYVSTMEDLGIVGPLNGSKPRDVLISPAQFLEMKARH